ncbi:MAG: hypothetical protein ACXW00_01835 [Methylobacter sp.]
MPDLSDAYARFYDLLTLAEEYFAAGDYSSSAALAQIAARCAWPDHVGLFGSPQLERLLLELGKQIVTASPNDLKYRDNSSRKILHVLTYGRPVGGDSRFVWRWMQADHNSQHSVAITSQAHMKGAYDVPESLRQSAENSGGFLHILNASASKPLEQANELRMLCQDMDFVVLHLFPYDIIPVLALAKDCDSVKTLYINHSDHTFWVGASVAHSIVHLRKQSTHFLKSRRGLRPDQSTILPIPLALPSISLTSAQAKHALGYDPSVVLLLTIASPFKFHAPGHTTFLDLVTPVISKLTQAVLIAVGPESEGAWRSASIQTNDRIVPLGARYDNDLLYCAADIYLDSVPFSSTTSLLEAGIHGVPLLGYNPPNYTFGLLGPGSPGLDNTMELASDIESYQAMLTRLISDADYRQRSGQRVKAEILSLHTGNNWNHAVCDLYAGVERNNKCGCLSGNDDNFQTSALDLALVQLYAPSRDPSSIGRLIRNYIGELPYRPRLGITWRLYSKGFIFCFFNLLPPPLNEIIRGVGRPTKILIQQILNKL